MASSKCREGPSLSRYASAPARSASMTAVSSRLMERIINLVLQFWARRRRMASTPVNPGMWRSRMAKSGSRDSIISIAPPPSEACPKTRMPLAVHRAAMPSRTILWSSARITVSCWLSCIILLPPKPSNICGEDCHRDRELSARGSAFHSHSTSQRLGLFDDRSQADAGRDVYRPAEQPRCIETDSVIAHGQHQLIPRKLEGSLDGG